MLFNFINVFIYSMIDCQGFQLVFDTTVLQFKTDRNLSHTPANALQAINRALYVWGYKRIPTVSTAMYMPVDILLANKTHAFYYETLKHS